MNKILNLIISSVLAGICIGIGGTVFLSLKDTFPGSNVVGALLFTVGLFTICTRGLHLYTGKVCYVFDNKFSYTLEVLLIWVGNLIGCATAGALVGLTRLENVISAANQLVDIKMNDSYISLFVLGIFCNMLIFIAVNGYANNPHSIGKYLALFLGVMVFILAGTEHSVADMYYWAVSGKLYSAPAESLLRILIITLGNAVGGVAFPLLEKAKSSL